MWQNFAWSEDEEKNEWNGHEWIWEGYKSYIALRSGRKLNESELWGISKEFVKILRRFLPPVESWRVTRYSINARTLAASFWKCFRLISIALSAPLQWLPDHALCPKSSCLLCRSSTFSLVRTGNLHSQLKNEICWCPIMCGVCVCTIVYCLIKISFIEDEQELCFCVGC